MISHNQRLSSSRDKTGAVLTVFIRARADDARASAPSRPEHAREAPSAPRDQVRGNYDG